MNEKLTEAAFRIGAELCRTAIWHKDNCNWIGRNMDFEKKLEFFESLGPDFYMGTSGVSFFLHHLYDATGEKIFKETATGALNHAVQHASLKSRDAFAFYSGGGGVIYVLLDLYSNTKQDAYLSKAKELLEKIIAESVSDADTDVISGAAGGIFLLIYAADLLGESKYTDKATELGNFLLAKAKTEENGYSWKTISGCERNLTGFSHGSAGIGLSLLLLHSKTHEQKFKIAAEKAFAYEDSFFNEQYVNWPDFRTDANNLTREISYSNAWCHGAGGIGLARLLAYTITKEPKLLSLAEKVSVSVMEKLPLCNNLSICHGFFGNAELPLLYARITENSSIMLRIEEQVATILNETSNNGWEWKCGSLSFREEPGLMCGIAGIGNFLIRYSHKFKYDSGLIIEKLFFN